MPRHKYDYDLVIIGAGSAGIVAGNVAGALGARVALVEKERIGGECLWTGCVPSKALLYAADVARLLRTGREYGLKNSRLSRDDCAGAFEYVRRKIEEVKTNDATEKMLRDFGVEIFFGASRFAGPHLLRTAQGDLRAASFLLAMGSSPVVPEIPGLAEAGYLTNKTLFDRDHIPASVVAAGGGYIACEMGQALQRLGAKVTIVERGERLLKQEDAELTAILADVLRGEGIDIRTNAAVTGAGIGGDGRRFVSLTDRDEARTLLSCDEILVAVGRRANTDGLNLADVGVGLDEKSNVRVDAAGRTTTAHIWACGDVTGQHQFSHMAEHEAKALVRNILFPGTQAVPRDVVPWATFTDPELARVGLTEAEAAAKFGAGSIGVLRHEFRQDDRAIVEGKTTGRVKVITAGLNGTVVGAHILGPGAGEMIHEWVLAMEHGLPVRAIADLIHVYPAVSVSNQRAAQRWYAGVMENPVVRGALSSLFGYHPPDIRIP